MDEQQQKIESLEGRIKALEEENNSLSDRMEEVLLMSLINENFDEVSDETTLLMGVLEKISVLKDIPYCACYEIGAARYNCLVQYCSFSNDDSSQVLLTLSDDLLKQLNSQPVTRLNLHKDSNLLQFESSQAGFEPGELLAIPFRARALSHGVFIFICQDTPARHLTSDLLPFQHIIRLVIDKWDRISLLNELTQLNHQLEDRVEERTLQLRQSEERYRLLFAMANDAIFLWDVNSRGEIMGCREMNDAVYEMTGYRKNDLQSIDLFTLLKDDYTAKERKHFQRLFARQSAIFRASFKTPKGILPMELHTRRFQLQNGQMILAIARDISKQLAYEQEIILAKNQAVESEKLKTAFLANMSHEIRTPMNAIIGFSELLSQDELKQNEVRLFADIIFKNSMHLLNLINDIVDYSKIEAGEVTIYNEPLNVNELISELSINMISILHKASKSHIDVLTHTPLADRDAVLVTDRTRLRQVLSNLINNAIKFTQKGFIEIGYQYNDRFLEFFVRDTGIGIAPENQKKVFERFVQIRDNTPDSPGGTGLGLAICSNLIERMSGHLCLQSAIGEGSTFWFTLPYTKPS